MSIIADIRDLRIQGARQIAIEALKYLIKFSQRNGFGKKFDIECRKLLNARPTAVVLHNSIERLKKSKSERQINLLINQLLDAEKKIAKNGKNVFEKKSIVMTHCHSHEVVSLLVASKKKISSVYVTETRPMMQGIATANDLSMHIKTFFIVDSAAGYYMPETDMLIIGADALRKEGIVNKIGTLMMALTAKELGKPVYVVADTMKIDRRPRIIIEKRPTAEVGRIKNVVIENPAFDITPWKYCSAVVTEKGILSPKKIMRMI
jgi:eIF-2B alpha/beta/delta-like uncharacterized protein